jgi:NADH:ubiquinone oxidoreductase subunit E
MMEVSTVVMDNDKIDQIIAKYNGEERAVIQVLMDIQHENHWLPREVLLTVSEKLHVPLSEIMEIVTFYKTFSLNPKGRHEVHVCMGSSCHLRGAQDLLDKVQEFTGIRPGETTADSRFSLESGNCLGCCTLGPEIVIDGKHHSRIAPDNVEDILKNYE